MKTVVVGRQLLSCCDYGALDDLATPWPLHTQSMKRKLFDSNSHDKYLLCYLAKSVQHVAVSSLKYISFCVLLHDHLFL